MRRVGKKQKKNSCKQEGFEKKIHASDMFKMPEDIFKKNIHTQLTTWGKNANIKNLPPPPITFLMVRPLSSLISDQWCFMFYISLS